MQIVHPRRLTRTTTTAPTITTKSSSSTAAVISAAVISAAKVKARIMLVLSTSPLVSFGATIEDAEGEAADEGADHGLL
jgi:hypothetical protein